MSAITSYAIQFTGMNFVTPVANAVCADLNKISYNTMTVNWGMQQMGTISRQAFQSMIFGAQMSMFYVSMLASGLLRTETATIGVDMAQDHLNDTIKRYGSNSQEAHRATQALERAHLMYQRQLGITIIMTASMGLQMISMTGTMLHAIPALAGLAASFDKLTVSVIGFLSTNPLGWAVLIGGAAVAVTAGAYLMTRSAELPSTLTINSGNTEQVLEDYKRRLKRAITQSGVP